MFAFPKTAGPAPKCYFTYCNPPNYVDEKNPPTKKKPFSTFLENPFSHSAELVLPNEIYELIKQQLDDEEGSTQYFRVNMSLADILEGDFFNKYIKNGNILMLSQGRPGVDNIYSLHEGILRLELDKATYERCGLVGKAIPDGNRKHVKSRFAIELNLRSPSMTSGRPGFDRMKYAFKNVLNHSVTWLFSDLMVDRDSESLVSKHHPLMRSFKRQVLPKQRTLCRDLASANIEALRDPVNASDLYEWLSMISLDSPRIDRLDKIDPYLSRYELPRFDTLEADPIESKPLSRLLVRVVWQGFLTAQFITNLWLIARKAKGEDWIALNVGCFGNRAYSLLEVGSKGTLVWEAEDRIG